MQIYPCQRKTLDTPRQVMSFFKTKLVLLKTPDGKLKHFLDYLGDLDN